MTMTGIAILVAVLGVGIVNKRLRHAHAAALPPPVAAAPIAPPAPPPSADSAAPVPEPPAVAPAAPPAADTLAAAKPAKGKKKHRRKPAHSTSVPSSSDTSAPASLPLLECAREGPEADEGD